MADGKAPTYSELVDRLQHLETKIAEMETTTLFIRRDPSKNAPTELDAGAMVPFDDGSTTELYWQTSAGLRKVAFTA
jgi:hypothetical protein